MVVVARGRRLLCHFLEVHNRFIFKRYCINVTFKLPLSHGKG
jgi:hypothetical protein